MLPFISGSIEHSVRLLAERNGFYRTTVSTSSALNASFCIYYVFAITFSNAFLRASTCACAASYAII